MCLPSIGTADEAGGVELAKSLSSRKKATKIFIPIEKQHCDIVISVLHIFRMEPIG